MQNVCNLFAKKKKRTCSRLRSLLIAHLTVWVRSRKSIYYFQFRLLCRCRYVPCFRFLFYFFISKLELQWNHLSVCLPVCLPACQPACIRLWNEQDYNIFWLQIVGIYFELLSGRWDNIHLTHKLTHKLTHIHCIICLLFIFATHNFSNAFYSSFLLFLFFFLLCMLCGRGIMCFCFMMQHVAINFWSKHIQNNFIKKEKVLSVLIVWLWFLFDMVGMVKNAAAAALKNVIFNKKSEN